jgi:flavin reductase (DIM6/NTAB) family NADH-FMN oxidoreductase RutF
VVNLATFDLHDEMGGTSEPLAPHVSEPETIGLEMAPSKHIRTPRVARSPAALECRYMKTVELHDRDGNLLPAAAIIGEVVSIYIDDAIIVDGRVDILRARPIARLGYRDYCVVDNVFALRYPK